MFRSIFARLRDAATSAKRAGNRPGKQASTNGNSRSRVSLLRRRRQLLETLEDRCLLAGDPTLGLNLRFDEITESFRTQVPFQITRTNTNLSQSLSVDVSLPADDFASIQGFGNSVFQNPRTYTFAPGQDTIDTYFIVLQDLVAENDRTLDFSVNATGFLPGSDSLLLVDDDLPSVVAAPFTSTLTEGTTQTINLIRRVDADHPAFNQPVTVDLANYSPGTFTVPSSVSFAAGQSQAAIQITAIDNAVYSDGGVQRTDIITSAPGYATAALPLQSQDDEQPGDSELLFAQLRNDPNNTTNGGLERPGVFLEGESPVYRVQIADTPQNNTAGVDVDLTIGTASGLIFAANGQKSLTVNVSAGNAFLDVPLQSVDDSVDEAEITTTTITATRVDDPTATMTQEVLEFDDESLMLEVDLPERIEEGYSQLFPARVISLDTGLPSHIPSSRLAVSSSDTNRLTTSGPSPTVGGASLNPSVRIPLATTDNAVTEGDAYVQYTTQLAGLSHTGNVLYIDDESIGAANDPVALGLVTVPGNANTGDTVSLSGAYTDANLPDYHTVSIDWGDGTTTLLSAGDVDEFANTFAASHVYQSPASYNIIVTIDDGQATDSQTSTIAIATPGNIVLDGNGTLSVGNSNDTVGDVTIELGTGGSIVVVGFGGDPDLIFNAGDVNEIVITSDDGDNVINVDADIITDVIVNAGNGNNTIRTGGGSDTVTVGNGNNLIRTRDGNDVIVTGDGNNEVFGGRGNDTVTTGAGNDRVLGGSGNDTLTTGAGADLVTGGGGDDSIFAGDGNDRVTGGGGADVIDAGNGNDRAFGGNGEDIVSGGAGQDLVLGNNGADILSGGTDSDVLSGGDGRDVLLGGENVDYLFAGGGSDLLIGNTTIYDNDLSALAIIRDAWDSAGNPDARLAALASGVGPGGTIRLVQGDTVLEDNALDFLVSFSSQDRSIRSGSDLLF